MLKPISSVASGRPRADSNYLFGGPDASKSAPRGVQEAKGGLNRFLDPPSGLQDRFGTHFGDILGAKLSYFLKDFKSRKQRTAEQSGAEQSTVERAGQQSSRAAEHSRAAEQQGSRAAGRQRNTAAGQQSS